MRASSDPTTQVGVTGILLIFLNDGPGSARPNSLFWHEVGEQYTVKTKFKVERGDDKHPEDRWYAWLNERWIAIPSDKIVPGYAPDGQAYLFVTDFVSEMNDGYPAFKRIVCFVRPKGGL